MNEKLGKFLVAADSEEPQFQVCTQGLLDTALPAALVASSSLGALGMDLVYGVSGTSHVAAV
jgi:hypothetical protein